MAIFKFGWRLAGLIAAGIVGPSANAQPVSSVSAQQSPMTNSQFQMDGRFAREPVITVQSVAPPLPLLSLGFARYLQASASPQPTAGNPNVQFQIDAKIANEPVAPAPFVTILPTQASVYLASNSLASAPAVINPILFPPKSSWVPDSNQ